MISYYDLLTMIKEGNVPKKVKYDDNTYIWNGRNYCAIGTDSCSYLSSDIDEVDMIEKNIEIIKPKKIEKLEIVSVTATTNDKLLASKINEIIEVLNEKEEIQNNKE